MHKSSQVKYMYMRTYIFINDFCCSCVNEHSAVHYFESNSTTEVFTHVCVNFLPWLRHKGCSAHSRDVPCSK